MISNKKEQVKKLDLIRNIMRKTDFIFSLVRSLSPKLKKKHEVIIEHRSPHPRCYSHTFSSEKGGNVQIYTIVVLGKFVNKIA